MTADMGFWKWRELVTLGNIELARANMTITMYDRTYAPIKQWDFHDAWPSKLSGPTLNSKSGDFSVDDLTITHEGVSAG